MIKFSTLALVILLLGLIFMRLILLREAKCTILLNQISKSIHILYTNNFFFKFYGGGGGFAPQSQRMAPSLHMVVVVVVFFIVLIVGNPRRPTLENRELYKACESAVDTMESVGVATKLYGL